MTTYNVATEVVDLIDAPDADTAKRILVNRLHAAGFDLVDPDRGVDAFVSDVDTEGNEQP